MFGLFICIYSKIIGNNAQNNDYYIIYLFQSEVSPAAHTWLVQRILYSGASLMVIATVRVVKFNFIRKIHTRHNVYVIQIQL